MSPILAGIFVVVLLIFIGVFAFLFFTQGWKWLGKTILIVLTIAAVIGIWQFGKVVYTAVMANGGAGIVNQIEKGQPISLPTGPAASSEDKGKTSDVSSNPSSSNDSNLPDGITLVGQRWLDPCTDGEMPDLQVGPLYENGKEVPNAYMLLDLNRTEVGKGLRYGFIAPAHSTVHLFVAVNDMNSVGNHFTYSGFGKEGGQKMVATAATIWCVAGDWDAQNAGKVRLMNAADLPAALLADTSYIDVLSNGIMPIPANITEWLKTGVVPTASSAPATTSQPSASTNPSCNAPTGDAWKWTVDTKASYWKYDSATALSFTVPSHISRVDYYNGVAKKSLSSASGAEVSGANTASAFCTTK